MKAWILILLLGVFSTVAVSGFTSKDVPRDLTPRKKGWERPPALHITNGRRGFSLNLFFKAREEESLKEHREMAQARIPKRAFLELSQRSVEFPFQFNLVEGDEESKEKVSIRYLEAEDLDILVPMCVEEFGDSKVTLEDLFKNFPLQEPTKIQQHVQEWWDDFALPYFIELVLRMKLLVEEPQDYSLLVATLQKEPDTTPTLVGLVELSQQPPTGYKNPSAFPVPLWYKEMYCTVHKLPKPNGWITNLLVAPEFRGRGYSKLLMAAAEGLARQWGCTAIHLHCDADRVGGKVPQRLYTSIGYEMVEDKNSPYGWMGSEYANKIYMIQGVALLFFRKTLT
jgi:GNAT superfamily N-acetyltransferase